MPKVIPFISGGVFKTGSRTIPVYNKYSNKVFAEASLPTAEEINDAFEQAHKAAPEMAALRPHVRAEILTQLHSLVSENQKEMAEILSAEAGKPIGGSEVEVQRCLGTLADGIREASTAPDGEWREHTSDAGKFSMLSRRFPVGVVSLITPFNFPLNLVAHKIAPAIAAGCPFVLKPSDRTPLSALKLGEYLAQTKMPKGSFSIMPCENEHAPLFSSNERIKVISFTGSAKVGWQIKENSGKKKVVLELGGNAACIVEPGANIEHVAQRILFGSNFYCGQSCIAVQRVIAHESVYDELCQRLANGAKAWNDNQGDPADKNTKLGPLITENDAKRVESWVNEAKEKFGGRILCGGKRNGAIFDATIIADVDKNAKVWKEEIFGPVATIHKYSDFKEAINLANDSVYGLQVGVFTNDMHKAFYAFEHLDVGGVVIGEVPTARVDIQPYGGVKDSGVGREGVRYAIEDFTELKVMVMKDIGELTKS